VRLEKLICAQQEVGGLFCEKRDDLETQFGPGAKGRGFGLAIQLDFGWILETKWGGSFR